MWRLFRIRNCLEPKWSRTVRFERNFLPRTLKLWNELPAKVFSKDYSMGFFERENFGSIELFRGGQHKQHTAMMVMAMLGFYFEVARHDRDKYIRVHMRHIRPDKLHHFEKIREDATLALPYDYESATHPAWQFWRKIGKTGISTVATFKDKDPDGSTMKLLGQNPDLLSDTDIVKINSVYGIKCLQPTRTKDVETENQPTSTKDESDNSSIN